MREMQLWSIQIAELATVRALQTPNPSTQPKLSLVRLRKTAGAAGVNSLNCPRSFLLARGL